MDKLEIWTELRLSFEKEVTCGSGYVRSYLDKDGGRNGVLLLVGFGGVVFLVFGSD